MADRSIVVRLRAQVDGFKREMAEATKAVEQTAKGTEDAAKRSDVAMGRLVQSAKNNQQAWNTAGSTLTGFGAAALGGLALATKAAIDWESAFAGVRKTVEASEPEFAALEAGLRGMARELPASHQEIAAVAEAAGQLGIATPNILGFTRTMIDMGEATNLSADEAATALARFITVTGTSQQEIGRLGATVVGLGNNFATTEGEIVALSQRLAAAGTQAGLSEGEIMGLATAMSQVGIEAEAGGSAMTQSMNRMAKAVEEGGDSLDLFAAVSGMTAEQFVTAWETEPAQALIAFTEGLADTSDLGMSTNGVLTELGITGLREADTMRRLALATGTMSDAMAMGNAEFEKGTALIDEANQRYETAESRIAMAKNAIVDAAISIGGTFLPVVATAADVVANFSGSFADLPGPIHGAIGSFGGLVGAVSLAGGAFLLTFPRVIDTVSAFRQLADVSPRTASGLGRVARTAGLVSAAFTVLIAAGALADMFSETAVSAEEMSSQLANLASTAVVTADDIDELVAVSGSGGASVKDFGYAVESVNMNGFLKGLDFVGSAFGLFDSDVSLAKEQIESLDQALSTFAMAGTMDHLAESFIAAVDSAAEYGFTAEDIVELMPGLQVALEPIATQMGLVADSTTIAKIASGELTPVFDETTGAAIGFAEGLEDAEDAAQSTSEALGELYDEMFGLYDGFLNGRRAVRDYEEALIDAQDAIDKNGKAWGSNTEAARENGEALDDVAQSVKDNAEAMIRNGEDVGGYLEGQREVLWQLARDFGATEEEATAYVDALGLMPEKIEQTVVLETEQAKEQWAALWDEIGFHPPEVPVGADTTPAEGDVTEFTGLVGEMPPGEVPVGADTTGAEEDVHIFGSRVGDVPTTPVVVDADTAAGQATLRAFQTAVNETGGTVEINGDTMYADEAFDTLIEEINAGDGTVTINGLPFPAEQALAALTESINLSEGTVTIEGNNKPANAATDSAKRHADNTTGTISVEADTSRANSDLNYLARRRTAVIDVSVTGNTSALRGSSMGRSMRAAGGPVFGPGTGTSDSIPAMLSNNEHVLTAAEVALAGGHDSIYRMRAAIRAGALRFADGGGVDRGGYAAAPVMSVAAPARAQQGVGLEPAAFERAVALGAARGVASYQPVMQFGDREVYGVMRRVERRFG